MTQKQVYFWTAYKSPVGNHYLLANEGSLMAMSLNDSFDQFREKYAEIADGEWNEVETHENPVLSRIANALDAYFSMRKPFPQDLPINPQGTPFQRKTWENMSKIPFGGTISYGGLAAKVGSPGAARAVGSACGANPIPIIIPCHRVLASSGGLGGFGGGLDMKRRLLELEGAL
ncbi:cysteine methyltransferase [candidate division LCP-89 bacterium B3_LCP]|uniref:methylated-DNA--[protein]-cysteine S-methyltransferase n=1 Tax=candidate division LCP-89 bacterium B3_LCP TaxID=2012998 RepID=A0A532UZF7_UNCL8|nr:MAG: cysteine methyltransferase [candidate division LCP-89 bacterium B3_LCP]